MSKGNRKTEINEQIVLGRKHIPINLNKHKLTETN